MNLNELRRTSIAIVALVALLGTASTAVAQDVTESDRATTDDIIEGAADRLEAGEEEERDVEELEAEADVDLDDVEAQREEHDPEELDRMLREMEAHTEEMTQNYRQLIQDDPQNPDRPNWMFEKAELMWDLADQEHIRERDQYNACMDAVIDGTREEDQCEEPDADYSEAQALYEQILQEFPDYDRLDEVIFRLGSALLDADEGPQGVEYLNRLVNEYPNSRYRPDAFLAMGDFWFEEHMTANAEDNYQEVLNYDDYRNYDYALYQLGWTYYNTGEEKYRDSVEHFQQVVERAEEDDDWGLLSNRALSDMLHPWTGIDDGWKEARDYFTDLRDIEFAYEQLERMAGNLESQGQDDDAIALYDWFIEERPDHPDVPDWMDGITRTVRDLDFDRYEDRVVEFVDYLHPEHTWYRQNQDDEDAIETADRWVENNLHRLGAHYHREGVEQEDDALFAQAAEYYQQFIDRFPDHYLSFDMTFFLGEIYLYNLDRFEDAARNYQHVVDLYQDDNVPDGVDEDELDSLVRDASYNVVVSYNNLVREHHPESVLVDMAERAGEDPEMTSEGIDEVTDDEGVPEAPDREDLLEWEEGFVQASDQFSEMYPDDDITPTVDYVAAEVYRDRGHFDNCIPRYENIIEHAPEHEYASFAGNSLLEANYRLHEWDEVERWARHLMEREIFDVTPEESLESAIAYAISQRAQEYVDDGDEDLMITGAEELLGLAEEFPESELAGGALFRAASVYSRADEINRAAEIYDRMIEEYPDDDEVPQALIIMGEIYQARTDFTRAAQYFERLGEEDYRDYTADDEDDLSAYDAVYNAAFLYQAMEEWDDAIDTYEFYMETFDEEIDDHQEIEYELAFLEQDRDNWRRSKERFEEYLDYYGDDVPLYETIEANTEIGRIIQRLEDDDWEERSEEIFTEVYETWEDRDLWFDEFGEEEGEQKRHAMRHDAAEAKFETVEFVLEDFRDVELDFPPDNLSEKAEKKADILTNAEREWNEIIEIGSPRWVAAASFRIGQGYRDFAEALYNLPIPDDVPPELEIEYELSVEDLARPLEDQALSAFERALDLALRYEAYNEWSARSAAEISDLQSGAFPITEQDGLKTEHNRVDFVAPDPEVSLDVVVERGAERRERLAPDEGPILNPDHPDYLPQLDPDAPEFIPELDPSHPEHDPELKQQFEEEHNIELDFYEDDEEGEEEEPTPTADATGSTR